MWEAERETEREDREGIAVRGAERERLVIDWYLIDIIVTIIVVFR